MDKQLLPALFKSVLEQDRASVVICDTDHMIIYMNPAAMKNYSKYGGEKLLGSSLLDCHNERSNEIIKRVVKWFADSTDNNMIYTYHNDKQNKDEYMVALRDEDGKLIGYYEKHEYRDPETAKFYDYDNPIAIV